MLLAYTSFFLLIILHSQISRGIGITLLPCQHPTTENLNNQILIKAIEPNENSVSHQVDEPQNRYRIPNRLRDG